MGRRQKMQGEFRAKLTLLGIGITAFVMLAAWVPTAEAFSGGVTQCVGCHPIWGGSGSSGHTAHLGLGLPNGCNTCHVSIGDTPVTATCGSCHVVPGVALHHTNAGASSCVGCHPGTPPPENTPVPGYATITAALDPCDGTEEQFASFTVSLDNDGDLLYDADDPDCGPSTETVCDNGMDDDGDGMTDCADQDCSADPACQAPQQETECADGVDNDNDGMVDCADPDCSADPACQPPAMEICTDGVDNDGDGMVDCMDSDCTNDAACQPPAMENCTDGVDNDGDGMIDCDDQDCANNQACQQPIMEDCDDRIDNDKDGFIDCMDPDCTKDAVCIPPAVEICTDGIDNDADGYIDCMDSDCSMDPACKTPPDQGGNPPADHTDNEDGAMHKPGKDYPFSNGCTSCHGDDLNNGFAPSCFTCHGQEWDEMAPGNGGGSGAPADHTDKEDGAMHKPGKDMPFSNGCTACHGQDLGGDFGPSCFTCHGQEWDEMAPGNGGGSGAPADHTDKEDGAMHKPGKDRPFSNGCTSCHGDDLNGGFGPSCFSCHGQEWDEMTPGSGDDSASDSGDSDDRRRKSKRSSSWDDSDD